MKMRLIDADKLKPDVKTFTSAYSEELTEFYSQEAIDNAPTVDADPVRHGEWQDRYSNGDWYCSECGAIVEKDEQSRHNWYRCYHCGAKMDGGEDSL